MILLSKEVTVVDNGVSKFPTVSRIIASKSDVEAEGDDGDGGPPGAGGERAGRFCGGGFGVGTSSSAALLRDFPDQERNQDGSSLGFSLGTNLMNC